MVSAEFEQPQIAGESQHSARPSLLYDLVTTVDRWGKAAGTTRSEAIRRLVTLALTVQPKGTARG